MRRFTNSFVFTIVFTMFSYVGPGTGHMTAPKTRNDDIDHAQYPVGYRFFRSRETTIANAKRHVALGQVDEAESLCEEILRDWYNHPECLIIHSHVHMKRGDHSRARQAVRDALDNDPTNEVSRNLLAQLLAHQAGEYFRDGDVEAAYEGYRQIILMDIYESKIPTQLLTEVCSDFFLVFPRI
jgi:Tfp pilus assembly protein PilF